MAKFSLTAILVSATVFVTGTALAEAPTRRPPPGFQDGASGAAKRSSNKETPARALERMTSRSDEGLTAVEHADGSVSVDLQGRFQSLLKVQRTDDGTVSTSCNHVDAPKATAKSSKKAANKNPGFAKNVVPVRTKFADSPTSTRIKARKLPVVHGNTPVAEVR